MNIEKLLESVSRGDLSVAEATEKLKKMPYDDLGFAKIDHHRALRKGYGEVVFGTSKTVDQLGKIIESFVAAETNVLATRVSAEQFAAIRGDFPALTYDSVSRLMKLELKETPRVGLVAVCAAGTGDLSVAEEAAQTAEFFGSRVARHYDVGVAGIHRLFAKLDDIRSANAVVAVAGMEGALGGVLAGLTDSPVIAVPTSVGYGTSFGGLSALLTMLNSCAEGMTVVNIDNGFGAGYSACQINRAIEGKK